MDHNGCISGTFWFKRFVLNGSWCVRKFTITLLHLVAIHFNQQDFIMQSWMETGFDAAGQASFPTTVHEPSGCWSLQSTFRCILPGPQDLLQFPHGVTDHLNQLTLIKSLRRFTIILDGKNTSLKELLS